MRKERKREIKEERGREGERERERERAMGAKNRGRLLVISRGKKSVRKHPEPTGGHNLAKNSCHLAILLPEKFDLHLSPVLWKKI
jgi:hypothetical protein